MRRLLSLLIVAMLAGQAWAGVYIADSLENTVSDTTMQSHSDGRFETSFYRYRLKRHKSETTYDNNGNPILYVWYKWNRKAKMWEKDIKREYAYNTHFQQTLYALYGLDSTSNIWYGWYKIESAYDADGRLTLDARYDWNNQTKTWKNYHKREYTYDADGNELCYAFYYWNPETNSWVNLYKYERTYNAEGQITTAAKYFLNTETNMLEKSDKRKNVVKYNNFKFVNKTTLFAEVEQFFDK